MANDKDFKVKNNLNVQGGTIYLDEGSETVKLVGNGNLDVYSDNLVKFLESDTNTLRATFDLNDNKFQFGSNSSSITDSQTHTVAISGTQGLKVSGTGYFGGRVQLLGRIDGQGAGNGSSASNISILRNVLLNPSAEDGAAIDPLKINDMAGVTYWGEITNVSGFYTTRTGTSGSYTYSGTVTASNLAWPSAFDGTSSTAGSWYTDDGVDGATQGTGTFTVDFDGQKTVSWTANVGIVFGSAGFTAEKIKIECYRNGAWQTECDISNNTDIAVVRRVANNDGNGVTKVRYTIGSAVGGSYFRIHSCFITGNAAGAHGSLANSGVFYLPKYGDAYQHGSFIPSLNDTYNIGNATYKHQTIYAMNLDAATSIKTGGVTRIDSSGNLTNVQGSFLGLGGGTLTGQLTLGATTSNNILYLDSASNKSSYVVYTSGSSAFSMGIPSQTDHKLVITTTDNLSGAHILTVDNTGAITIAPPALAGVQDGITLYDRTDGGGEGLSIKWKSGTDADTAELIGQSFDQLLVKTGGADRGKFGTSGLYLNNGLQVDSTTHSTSTGGINFTLTDDIADQNFTGVRIDHNISGSQAINTGEDYSHIGLFIDQDSTSTHTGTNPTVDEHRMYGLYVDSRGGGVSDIRRGVYSYTESQHSQGQVSEITAGSFTAVADETGTGRTVNTHGVYGLAYGYASGTGGDNSFYGGYFKSLLTGNQTKNAANVTGVFADVEIDDPSTATTVANIRAFWGEIDNDDTGGNRTVTNAYLFYGNYVGDLPATNNWGIYIADDVRSYFSGRITTKSGVEGTPSFAFNGDTDTGMWSPAANTVAFSTGGSESVRIVSTGNVGIGTTSPTDVLEVSKQLSAAQAVDFPFVVTSRDDGNSINQAGGEGVGIKFRLANNSASTPATSFVGAGIAAIRENASDDNSSTSLAFYASQNDETLDRYMTIRSSGNVGIGTTAPEAKLDINGTTKLGTSSYSAGVDTIADGSLVVPQGSRIVSQDADDNYLRTIFAHDAATGNYIFGQQGTSLIADMVFFPGSTGNFRVFASGSEDFRVASTGNVGIGTTSPNAPLEIHGADIATGATTTASSVLRLVRDIVDPTHTLRKDSAVDFMLSRQEAVANNLPYTRLDIRLAGTTDTSTPSLDVMSLLHNGNVGIGTTSPSSRLNVVHSSNGTNGITVKNATTGTSARSNVRLLSDAAQFDIYATSSTYNGVASWADAGVLATSSNASGGLILNAQSGGIKFQDATTEIMRVSDGGKVGIGTTAPDEKLVVRGANYAASQSGGIAIQAGDDTSSHWKSAFKLKSDENGVVRTTIDASTGQTAGQVNEAISISTAGKVAIGASSPRKNLHVYYASSDSTVATGNGLAGGASGSGVLIQNTSTSGNTYANLDFRARDADGRIAYQYDGGSNKGDFHFITDESAPASRLTIKGDGKVGIGTTAPAGNLHIRSIGNVGDATLIVEADADNNSENDNPKIEFRQDAGLVTGALYLEGDADEQAANSLQNGIILDAKGSANDGGTIQFATGGIAAEQTGGPTNSAVAMTILRNGQVGINNANPTNGWLSVQTPANEGNVYAAEFFGTLTYQPPNSTIHNVISNGVYIQAGGVMGGLTDYALMVKNRAGTSTLLSVKGSGNVGIGTNIPVQPLQVSGNIYSNGGDFFVDAGRGVTSVDSLVLEADENDNGDNTYIAFRTDGSEKARMTSTGHLGLGTDKAITPLHITEVGGSARPSDVLTIETTRSDVGDSFTGGAIKFVNSDTNSAGMARIKVGSSNDATDNPIGLNSEPSQSFIFETAVGANVGITSVDGDATTITVVHSTHTFAVGQKIAINTGSYQGSYYINTVTSDTQFTIADTDHDLDQYTGSAVINYGKPRDSMIIRGDGNVGIGTNSPTTPLTVKSNSTSSQDAGFTLQANGSTNSIFKVGEKGGGKARLHMFAGTVEKIALHTDGTASHISAGNFGIGRNDPAEKLHVEGNMKLSSIGSVTLTIQADSDNATGETEDGEIKFQQDGSHNMLHIGGNGDLNAPSHPGLLANSAYVYAGTGHSGTVPLQFGTNSQARMILTTTGNLGIGTNSPSSKLHVATKAAAASDLTMLTLENGDGTGDITTPDTWIDFVFKDTNANAFPQARIGAHAGQGGDANTPELEGNGYLTFHTSNPGATTTEINPPERMRIAHNGHVGIGNTSPTNGILSVVAPANKGNVYAAEFIGTLPYQPPNSTILNTSSNGVRIRAGGSIVEEYALRVQNQSGLSELFCVQGDGDVGIGTNTPQDALDVVGTVRISQNLRFGTGQTVSSIETAMAASPTDTQLLTAQGVKEYVDNNAGNTYTAGDGLTLTGSDFDINKGTSGDWWGDKVVHIPSDGVVEVGKYLDWHSTDAGTSDYDYRMTAGVNSMTFSNNLLVQGEVKANSNFRVEGSGDLLKVNITAWSANAVQSILHNGYATNTGDNIVLKCAGNGTSHGAIFVGDNVFSYGKCNSAADTDNSATDPLPNGTAFSVTAAGAASFESSVSSGSDMTISTNASSHGRIVSNRLLIDSATEFVVGSTIGASFENSITCTANGSTSLYYDGSFRIGTVTGGVSVTGDLDVTGAISGTTKSFDIEHPTKKGKRLHHGVLEGPEHAVYIRGRSKNSTIELPEYWLGLVHEETITVQLTAIGKSVDLYVKDIIDNSIEVENDCEYFYFIQAERKDVERFEVEYEQ